MPPGKLASQAGHAFAQTLLAFLAERPEKAERFRAAGSSGTRIVLIAKDEEALRSLMPILRDADIPHALFEDSGHVLPPHFDGSPVVTALGIGPTTKRALGGALRRLRCA
jgi:PTH2 family peptidyl-tRNA hydrolase